VAAKVDEMFYVSVKIKLAQTESIENKDIAFKQLDEALEMAKGIAKLSSIERKHLQIQSNNTKKNILYKRNEKKETIPYLLNQLEIIGDNEAVFGTSLINIYNDLAYIHYELNDWDECLSYYHKLKEVAMKNAAITHTADEILRMVESMVLSIMEKKRLAAMNPVSRLRTEHPGMFYASILTLAAGAGVIAFKLISKN